MHARSRLYIFFLPVLFLAFPGYAHATVIITEIMYDVPTSTGADDTREWVEVANTGTSAVDLTGWKFNDGANHTLNVPPANGGTGSPIIPAGGVAIFADNATTFLQNLYPSFSGTVLDTTMSLNNTNSTLALINASGAVEGTPISYAKTMGAAGDGNTLGWNGNAFAAATPTPGVYTDTSSPPSDSGDPDSSSSDSSVADTSSVSVQSSAPAEYLPIPMLRIVTGGDRTVSSGADTTFTALVYDAKGHTYGDAFVSWSFGDGMQKTGASVFHTYYDSGEYLAVVRAVTSDGGDVSDEIVVTVEQAELKIASVSARGITLVNNSPRTLDLSLWRLVAGGQEFKIPAGTHILAGRTVLFPSQIIELPLASSAALLYPSGEVASVYPGIAAATASSGRQLSAPNTGSNQVQTVEPIISTSATIENNEEAIRAPAAATELAAAGAALPSSTTQSSGILHSPWLLGLLGVIALAGGAFMIL